MVGVLSVKRVFEKDKRLKVFDNKISNLEKDSLYNNQKTLSKMYKLLLNWQLKDEEIKDIMIKWEQDLGHTIELDKWKELWEKNIKFTACYIIRENLMKMQYRWYWTPVKLVKINKTHNKCWRCKNQVGTFYRMWWACPEIRKFWDTTYEEMKKLLKITFNKKPE